VRISSSNAGYTIFRGSVKRTGYPLHSPVSPSLSLPCVDVYHHISTGLYQTMHMQLRLSWYYNYGGELIKILTRRALYYNVTRGRVCVTTVAMKRKYVLHIMSVCLHSCLSRPARQAHAPYYTAICELSDSTIFCHIISYFMTFA